MRVGRGDGSTDDADVCGLRTVRHTRPEVELISVGMWVWLLERRMYVCMQGLLKPSNRKREPRYPACGAPHQATITHAGGAVFLVRYHGPSRMLLLPWLDEVSLLDASRVYIYKG
jgi:hypothetical protein